MSSDMISSKETYIPYFLFLPLWSCEVRLHAWKFAFFLAGRSFVTDNVNAIYLTFCLRHLLGVNQPGRTGYCTSRVRHVEWSHYLMSHIHRLRWAITVLSPRILELMWVTNLLSSLSDLQVLQHTFHYIRTIVLVAAGLSVDFTSWGDWRSFDFYWDDRSILWTKKNMSRLSRGSTEKLTIWKDRTSERVSR